jgi:hypothetical protein
MVSGITGFGYTPLDTRSARFAPPDFKLIADKLESNAVGADARQRFRAYRRQAGDRWINRHVVEKDGAAATLRNAGWNMIPDSSWGVSRP